VSCTDYLEDELRQKAAYFAAYERGRNLLFEGEDRARFFFWQTTPFYSQPLMQYALRLP
jgi:asparagine synthase (glutamine-hydrolysing)